MTAATTPTRSSPTDSLGAPPISDARARRREVRRAQSRTEILDAAERVFGEDGIQEGSLRRIATLAGYSTGALYLFFESKAALLAETLTRRGDEWESAVRTIVAGGAPPMDQIHQTIDFALSYFAEHPHFRRLLNHVSRGTVIAGHSLAVPSDTDSDCFTNIMASLAAIIEDGQASGEIRQGEPKSLAHLYSVVLNEHIRLASTPGADMLTPSQFHGFVDGALRAEPPH